MKLKIPAFEKEFTMLAHGFLESKSKYIKNIGTFLQFKPGTVIIIYRFADMNKKLAYVLRDSICEPNSFFKSTKILNLLEDEVRIIGQFENYKVDLLKKLCDILDLTFGFDCYLWSEKVWIQILGLLSKNQNSISLSNILLITKKFGIKN